MNGKAHGIATKIATPAVGLAVGYATGDVGLAIAAALGTALGLIIDPDMDCNSTLAQMNASRWRMMQLWRPVGYLWFALWYPYGVSFSHRGVSHTPIIGTATRLLYLAIFPSMLAVILAAAGVDVASPLAAAADWVARHNNYFIVAIIGLSLSDIIHWVMDKV